MLHRLDGAFAAGCGRSHVVGVGGVAVAGQFGQDVRAALLGVLQFLDDDDAGAFAHDEAVAVLVEGTRGVFRIVVARAQGAHGGKTAHAEGDDGRFAAAGEDDVGIVVADEAPGLADAVVGSGAGGDDGRNWGRQSQIPSRSGRRPCC